MQFKLPWELTGHKNKSHMQNKTKTSMSLFDHHTLIVQIQQVYITQVI